MNIRSYLRLAAGFAASVLALATYADSFPAQPIKMTVPFAAGGPADTVARLLAQNTKLGQPIIIDNRAGAGGTVGAQVVARAVPDGHNILFVTAGHAGASALYPKLGFDPEKGFETVIGSIRAPIAIAVKADAKYRTLQELVADARARPGALNCAGGAGGATITNLAFEALKADLGIQINAVPYRGSAPAMTALLSGEIDCASDNVTALLPHLQAGTIRALAVTTRQPFSLLPDVPSVAQTVRPDFEASAWFGVLVPHGTPKPIIDALYKDFRTTLERPDVRDRLRQLGMETLDQNPAEFRQFMASETKRWGALIKKLGLTPQ